MKGEDGLPGPRVSDPSQILVTRVDLFIVKMQKPVIDDFVDRMDVSPQGPEGRPGPPGASVVGAHIQTCLLWPDCVENCQSFAGWTGKEWA